MGNPHDNKPTPHMQPAPEGVSEAEIVRHMTHEEWRGCRIESYRWKFKIPEALQGSEWDWSYASHWSTPAALEEAEALVSVKDAERALLSALSSERERAERAEAERDDAIARWCIRMADVREASGVGVKPMLDEVPSAIKARIDAIEARAQAAEAKVEELEAPFDWTAEDLVDLMAEAIMDAIDLDTSATDYARAALIALNKEGLLRPNDYREPDQ